MNNPAPDTSPSFAPWLPANFFSGGGGSGGGGGFGQPTVFNLLTGYTHTVWTDQYGNQKHQVTDTNNNVVQQAAAAFAFSGTIATVNWQTHGQEIVPQQSFSLDFSQMPQSGPWKIPVGNGQIVAHTNNVVNGSGTDPSGNPWTSVYTWSGGPNASFSVANAVGSGTWTIPLIGNGPMNQIDYWALLAFFEAVLALVLGLLEAPMWLVILILLLVIAGAWWFFTHANF